MQTATPRNDLLLRAARRERTERTPVWMMRQAGRFDPAYRELRARLDLPLEELFRTPEVAARISLLPRRLGVDAIIFYQDILTPLAPMGAEFLFRPGPVLREPLRDLEALHLYDPAAELGFVAETLRLVRAELGGELPLLGFAGAPLTLAFFLLEGGSPGAAPRRAWELMRTDPARLHRLLERLSAMTVSYLELQIEAGVDAVQLFESVGDLLSEQEYRCFAHPYHQRIFAELGRRVPAILFVKEQPLVELMAASGAEVLSVGTCVDLERARRAVGGEVALQGNLDNRLLRDGTPAQIEAALAACLRAGGRRGHIFNLSHGLLPDTPFENVRRVIAQCRESGIAGAA